MKFLTDHDSPKVIKILKYELRVYFTRVYKFSKNVLCYFANDMVCLLHIRIPCCKVNDTIQSQQLFSFYFDKYQPHKKCFKYKL